MEREERQRAARQREQLSTMASHIAATRGFAALTIEALATAANQPAPVVRDLFGSDDDLVEYAIVEEMGQVFAEVTVLFEADGPPSDVVVEATAYAYRRLVDTVTFRQLLGEQRHRLMKHLLGDSPETLIFGKEWVAEELRALSARTGVAIEVDGSAEFMIRMMLSLLTSPQLGPDLSEDGVVEAIIRRWLLPGIVT